MSSSDVIAQLSYTVPLLSGGIFTTEKVIAGQFSSLNLSFASDVSTSVLTQFSNDGTNWDINIVKNFDGGKPDFENLVILGKWMRLIITNTGGVNQSFLRVYTYGSVQNTNLNAIISKIGNKSPEVSIDNRPDNIFGEFAGTEYRCLGSYEWDYVQDGYLNGAGGVRFASMYEPDYSIHAYSGGITTDGVVIAGPGYLQLSTNETTLNEYYMLVSRTLPNSVGIGMEMRFNCAFQQPTIRTNNQRQLMGMINVGEKAVWDGVLCEGYMIGFNDTSVNNDEVEIVWYQGGVIKQSFPRSTWNVDKADGTQDLPLIDFTKMNEVRIQVGEGCVGCLFSVYANGHYYPIHRIRPYNFEGVPQFHFSQFTLGMAIKEEFGSSTLDGYIRTGSWGMGLNGDFVGNSHLVTNGVSGFASSAAEEYLFSIRNKNNRDGFLGKPYNMTSGELNFVSASSENNGSNTTIIRIYRNPVLTAPAWIATGNLIVPTEWDLAATSFPGGILIREINMPSSGNFQQLLNSDFSRWSGLYQLEPGTIYTFTAQTSGGNGVLNCAISWSMN